MKIHMQRQLGCLCRTWLQVVEPTETLPSSEPVTGSHSAEGLGPACAEYLQVGSERQHHKNLP